MTEKLPTDQIIRVPTPLVPILEELSNLYTQGHEEQTLKGLQELTAAIGRKLDDSSTANPSAGPEVIADLLARVKRLEQVVDLLPPGLRTGGFAPPLKHHNSGFNQSVVVGSVQSSSVYEDVEDEPDEILYDFLEPGSNP
ncbi:hypothetical protein [Leptolyngbya sp. FACHB-261]|uniref:hypothetical protein n=1 Tax=Leptolyngbya sp. FACHB-261 TaxID=2692806 RepID=UPI0016878325|nr:hypothetical protein [Leptolyngbya sp. FACHB-261]MBD2101032.1 hypothetical protein [Leptolyngbya sp. FACHB-261]